MFILGLLFVTSCTVYNDPDPIFEEEESSVVVNKRRVLVINIDGAIGEVVKEVMPTNIASLLPTSKYSFSTVSDKNSSYGSTWASISKGVGISSHLIANDLFTVDTEEGEHGEIPYFPSFYYRLEGINPNYKTSIMMRDSILTKELFNDVLNKNIFTTDNALVGFAENYLKTTPDMMSLVQLSSVMEAGRNSGFGIGNPAYVAAIHEVDAYVGRLIASVKSRATYNDEEWLIIVQSNNGGSGNSTGGLDYASSNIFVVLNYPRFNSYEFSPRFINGTRFFKRNRTISDYDRNGLIASGNTAAYDLIEDEMTIEFFIKANSTNYNSASNTFVFGKSTLSGQNASTNTNRNGWFFYQRNKATAIYLAFDDNTSFLVADGFPPYTTGKWDHISITIKKTGLLAELNIYSNGVLTSTATRTLTNANAKIVSSAPFKIQHGTEHGVTFHNLDLDLAEIRIFNKALTAEQIARHSCLLSLSTTDDAYADLTGYYPLGEDFNNKIASGPNLIAMPTSGTNATVFPNTSASSAISTSCDVDLNKSKVISNIDVAPLTFYWLRKDYSAFGWNANNPLKDFESEFLGLNN